MSCEPRRDSFSPSLDRHRRAGKMLTLALASGGTAGAWLDAARVWHLRLSAAERAGLFTGAALAVDPATAEAALAELYPEAGQPLPPFIDYADEAAHWASLALPAELRAYLEACWRRIPERDRRAFLARIDRRAA